MVMVVMLQPTLTQCDTEVDGQRKQEEKIPLPVTKDDHVWL